MKRRTLGRALFACLAATLGFACSWNPLRPFEREAPAVKEAIVALDAGDADFSVARLQDYLSTGPCKEGSMGVPDLVRRRPNGSFDLGLALFSIAEAFGGRFGDEQVDAGLPPMAMKERSSAADCALKVTEAIANDDLTPLALRAKAHYLEGNLHFLVGHYESAVAAYDRALGITPGVEDAGTIGVDAAWNRAIALRRIDDEKDAGRDASNDHGDGGGSSDSGTDSGKGDSGSGDGGKGGPPDGGHEDSGSPPPPAEPPDSGVAPPPRDNPNQDERMLDQLERAPTLQQEHAKTAAGRRRVRGMADK